MDRVNSELIARGKFSWQGLGGGPRGAYQPWVENKTCAADLRRFCVPSTQNRTMFYGFWPGPAQPQQDPGHLPQFAEDLANFLLIRSPYAWIGHGWMGTGPCRGQCNANEDHTAYTYYYPVRAVVQSASQCARVSADSDPMFWAAQDALNDDYGEPLGICHEIGHNGSGVFRREWSRASVQMDCNTYTPTITWKN